MPIDACDAPVQLYPALDLRGPGPGVRLRRADSHDALGNLAVLSVAPPCTQVTSSRRDGAKCPDMEHGSLWRGPLQMFECPGVPHAPRTDASLSPPPPCPRALLRALVAFHRLLKSQSLPRQKCCANM